MLPVMETIQRRRSVRKFGAVEKVTIHKGLVFREAVFRL